MGLIDTSFDFRSDTPNRPHADPDADSPTLPRYHRLLWSKPPPDGTPFEFDATHRNAYQFHRTARGEDSWLASDTVMQTFTLWLNMRHIVDQLSAEENDAFVRLGYTIGDMMDFPGNQIGGQWTLNQARGMNSSRIGDRMDLTLECIRRFYAGDTDTPLGGVIARYDDFFALFGDFDGYVGHFLLQDLVDGSSRVQSFMPFEDFSRSALPRDVDEYRRFRDSPMTFIRARNERIASLGL